MEKSAIPRISRTKINEAFLDSLPRQPRAKRFLTAASEELASGNVFCDMAHLRRDLQIDSGHGVRILRWIPIFIENPPIHMSMYDILSFDILSTNILAEILEKSSGKIFNLFQFGIGENEVCGGYRFMSLKAFLCSYLNENPVK